MKKSNMRSVREKTSFRFMARPSQSESDHKTGKAAESKSFVEEGRVLLKKGKSGDAARLFKKAGESGYGEGFLELGLLYEKAALHGNEEAKAYLGLRSN